MRMNERILIENYQSGIIAGSPPFIDVPEDVYPVVVDQEHTKRKVVIVQAAAFTKFVSGRNILCAIK